MAEEVRFGSWLGVCLGLSCVVFALQKGDRKAGGARGGKEEKKVLGLGAGAGSGSGEGGSKPAVMSAAAAAAMADGSFLPQQRTYSLLSDLERKQMISQHLASKGEVLDTSVSRVAFSHPPPVSCLLIVCCSRAVVLAVALVQQRGRWLWQRQRQRKR